MIQSLAAPAPTQKHKITIFIAASCLMALEVALLNQGPHIYSPIQLLKMDSSSHPGPARLPNHRELLMILVVVPYLIQLVPSAHQLSRWSANQGKGFSLRTLGVYYRADAPRYPGLPLSYKIEIR